MTPRPRVFKLHGAWWTIAGETVILSLHWHEAIDAAHRLATVHEQP